MARTRGCGRRCDHGGLAEVSEPHYRGQNANMHLMEASLAAFEATGDERHLRRAESISELIVHRNAEQLDWRLPEHFDENWAVVPEFNRERPDDPFRPFGSLVGHWFEWARLLLQFDALPGARALGAGRGDRALRRGHP